MAEQIKMIGRKEEMKQLDSWIKEQGTTHLVCIQGEGGIGKTRLLQEILKKFERLSAPLPPVENIGEMDDGYYLQRSQRQPATMIQVSEIIDFDDRYYNVASNLEVKIGHLLSQFSGKDLNNEWLKLRRLELIGSKSDPYGQPEEQAHKEFVKFFNQVAAKQRIGLLFDTIEAPRGPVISIYLLKLIKDVKNCAMIVAGRSAKTFFLQAEQEESSQYANLIELTQLDNADSQLYLREKLTSININIDEDMSQKLLLLAQGMPLLLDLAVDWLAHSIPLDWVRKMNLRRPEALTPEDLVSLRKEFRAQLVSHFCQPKTPMDYLVLWLSRVNPLDPQAISRLLYVDLAEARALIKEAKTYVFIKTFSDGRISLHDEMRAMIEEFVWPYFDPDKSRQKRDSLLATEYLSEKIQELEQRIASLRSDELAAQKLAQEPKELDTSMERRSLEEQRWLLKDHLLEHLLFSYLDKGVQFFAETFDEATRAYKFLFRKNLLEKVQAYRQQLNKDQLYMVESREVKFRLDSNDYDYALGLAEAILHKGNLKPDNHADMLIQHGNIQMRRGEVRNALKDFQSAVRLSQEHMINSWIVKAYNARGWCYRTMGNLEKAMSDYNRAFDFSLRLPDQRQIAAIYNNMGNVLAYQGLQNDAIEKCNKALDIWKKESYGRGVGTAYCTLAEIFRRFNRSREAEDNYNYALDVFTSEDDLEWMSIARCGRGQLFWTQGRLKDAKEDLEWALQNSPGYLKPRVYHSLGEVYRSEELIELALEQFQLAFNRSQDFGDRSNELKSYVSTVNLAWELGQYPRWHEFYQGYLERYHSWVGQVNARLMGSLLRNLGDLAISHGDYDDAFGLYFDGIKLTAQYETNALYKVDAQLMQSEKRIRAACPKGTLARLGSDLGDKCRKEPKLVSKRADLLDIFHRWVQGELDGKKD